MKELYKSNIESDSKFHVQILRGGIIDYNKKFRIETGVVIYLHTL